MLIFLSYCFLKSVGKQTCLYLPSCTSKHMQQSSPNDFIQQSLFSDPRQLYTGLYSVYLGLNSVCLLAWASQNNAHLLFGWHSFTHFGRTCTSIDFILGLVRKLLKSADKHNRSKQHKNLSFYNGFLSQYLRRYYESYKLSNVWDRF